MHQLPHPSKIPHPHNESNSRHARSTLLRVAGQTILDAPTTTHAVDINFSEAYEQKLLEGARPPIETISRLLVEKFNAVNAHQILIVLESTNDRPLHCHCLISTDSSTKEIRAKLKTIRNLATRSAIHINSGTWTDKSGVTKPIDLGKVDYFSKELNRALPNRPKTKTERKLYMSLQTRRDKNELFHELHLCKRLGIESNIFDERIIQIAPVESQNAIGNKCGSSMATAPRISYVSDYEKSNANSESLNSRKAIPRGLCGPLSASQKHTKNWANSWCGSVGDINNSSNHTNKEQNTSTEDMKNKTQDFIKTALESETDDCIPWPFSTTSNGYPIFKHNGKTTRVNRYICETTNGRAPDKHHAAHSCGNRACINKKHLSWKTATENQRDKLAHGTHGKKLTTGDAIQIKFTRNIKPKALADRFQTTPTTIRHIKNNKTWQRLFLPYELNNKRIETLKQMVEVLSSYHEGGVKESEFEKKVQTLEQILVELETTEQSESIQII